MAFFFFKGIILRRIHHWSPTGSNTGREPSDPTPPIAWFSVLPALPPPPRSLEHWAVEGARVAGSASQRLAERLSRVLVQACRWIQNSLLRSCPSLDWLYDVSLPSDENGSQECRMNCTPMIHRRSTQTLALLLL